MNCNTCHRLLIIITIANFFYGCTKKSEPTPVASPINPVFIKFMEENNGSKGGVIPSPIAPEIHKNIQ